MRPDFVTTGSTVYAVNEIVSYLTPKLTGNEDDIDKVSEITRHVGRFDKPDEIKNWMSRKDGGIRIAALRVRNIDQSAGQMTGDVDLVAYVFCTEQFGYSRDQRAEVIAGRLAKLLLANKGVPTANKKAESLNMDNLYSGDVDGLGLAIWSVSWTQNWVLDKPITAADLDDFVTMYATAEIADGAPTMDSDITLDQ
ncbi:MULTISPECIES: hypothetical protein [Marinomonas]|uniref:Uncharacterized protein n=1 Tax=Marinomonas rhodophyticola TaxID=2992803 RepID=A0ABT3KCL1_9GAMM|nr:hypothetical protein [Marinomonas sp. KJ51-3]MCW4628280.1 hypothetical protein [Marinomonas sp. KJ51-3]